MRTWEDIGSPELTPSEIIAWASNETRMEFEGVFQATVNFRNMTCLADVYVSKTRKNLLGNKMISELGLWNRPFDEICSAVHNTTEEVLKNKYMERMENAAGRCTKTKISLKAKTEKKPVFKQSRRVPFAVQSSVEAELERLQAKGIIYPTNYSAWAAPVVAVKKPNGQIRLCADYSTGLNDALEDYHYPLPTLEQIFATLNGGKVFARIDLSEAYLQIEVDEKAQELLTINTHKGLFRYTRLNYGVKTAPSVFQQIMDTMLTNVPGTIAYLDDILVVGSSEEELTQRLDQVVYNLIDYGLKINMEKSEFLRKEIHYLGFIVNENGRAPDPERVKAFQNMKVPKNTKELQSFMGLVSYYGPFITGLHSLKPPLSRLLCKDVEFIWSPECQNAFDAIKTKICDSTMLSHFEADKETIVQADASDYGLGGVLLQKDADGRVQPIMHAARSLTKAERNYSQTEKEALAIIFAVQRFHLFIYGRPFTLHTDHQPLKFLLGTNRGVPQNVARRIQRWSTILQNYDFQIQYVPTQKFGAPDALSRLSTSNENQEDVVVASTLMQDDDEFRGVIRQLPLTAEHIRATTAADPLLRQVKEFIRNGWPRDDKVHLSIKPFRNRKEQLYITEDCIMYDGKVVIPARYQQQVLRELHAGHQGMTRMKQLARKYVYWPGIDNDVEFFVRSCGPCGREAKNPPKVPPVPWPEVTRPCSRVHMDFAGPFFNQMFLIVVDAWSKWLEVFDVSAATADITARKTEELIARYGIPTEIVTDNGTQFTSSIFQQLCQKWGIRHVTSPPFHPQSNGQAERFVDTFKRAMKKMWNTGVKLEYLNTFLFAYRTTPKSDLGDQTPAERFLGRQPDTRLQDLQPEARVPQTTKYYFREGEEVFARNYKAREKPWIEDASLDWSEKDEIPSAESLYQLSQISLADYKSGVLEVGHSDPQSSIKVHADSVADKLRADFGDAIEAQSCVEPNAEDTTQHATGGLNSKSHYLDFDQKEGPNGEAWPECKYEFDAERTLQVIRSHLENLCAQSEEDDEMVEVMDMA
nr:unnamed protein product [Spirometra erinaceieuropaei]